MPTEVGRTTARKRITLPGGAQIDVPVITKISFLDPSRGQETQFTISNDHTGVRTVHVDTISVSTGELKVERIDGWPTFDATDRAQETQFTFDNVKRGQNPPPYFIAHVKTHVVRYFDINGDENNYIESELIDAFTMFDAPDRAQETVYTLNNPQNDDDAQADSSDPEISDSDNGIDPPWRTDPFQNIVNFNESGQAYLEYWIDFDYGWTHPYPNVGYIPPSLCPEGPGGDQCGGPEYDVCGGGITGGANGFQDHLYLMVKPRLLSPNYTSTGIPAKEDIDVGIPGGTVGAIIAARANREEVTGTGGNAMDPADAAKYPGYKAIFAFDIEEWVPVADGGNYCHDCPPGHPIQYGIHQQPINRDDHLGPHSYDLTGATITQEPTTDTGEPFIYDIIGTADTVEYSPYRESPLPWNEYCSNRNVNRYPVSGPLPPYHSVEEQYWAPYIPSMGFCYHQPMYCFRADSRYPDATDPTVPGIVWAPWFRVYCLFKKREPTA